MDMTVGQLVYVLRKRISLPAEKAIFVFVNNTCGPPTASHLIRLPARAREASLPPTPRTVWGVSPRCLGSVRSQDSLTDPCVLAGFRHRAH